MKRNVKILNPFFLFVGALIVDIILYSFHLSELYPELTLDMICFLIFLILFFLIDGYIFSFWLRKKEYIVPSSKNIHRYKKLTIFSIVGTILEGIYSKGFPLITNMGYGNDAIKTYGIPVFHVFLTIYISFLINTIFFNNLKYKSNKYKLYILINFGCLILELSRSIIVITLLNCLWLFVIGSQNKKKAPLTKRIFLIFLVIFGLYLFGIFGNYRSNLVGQTKNNNVIDSTFIFQVGQAKESVQDNKKLGPFFWSYLYLSSPLSNFQNLIENKKKDDNSIPISYLLSQYLPDTIDNILFPNSSYISKESSVYLVNQNLNVSTVFFDSYFILGWFGVILMVVYMLIIPYIYLKIILRFFPKYYVYSLSFLCTTYVLNLFSNMFVFSVTSLLLLFPIFIGLIEGVLPKLNGIKLKE